MLEGHISKAYDGALATLHMRVVEMGGLVLDQVREATNAYTTWNAESAARVLEREGQVNDYRAQLDDEQLTLIARRQPMATDLKIIMAISRSVSELERAGDEAKKIARTVLGHSGRPASATSRDARHLGQLAVDLLRLSLEGFDGLDVDLAAEVITRDQELDEEYAAGLRRLMTRAMEDPRHMEATVQAAFVLKALERIGDHARNLARHVTNVNGDARPLPRNAATLADDPSLGT